MSQSNPVNHSPSRLQSPHYHKNNDEIDLRELFLALWKGKSVIIVAILFFGIISALYANKQPNIYQSTAKLIINPDPYGFVQSKGFSPGSQVGYQAEQALSVLKSQQIQSYISEHDQVPLAQLVGLSISKARNGDISVSKTASSPGEAYISVYSYVANINNAYKALQLQQVQVSLSATKNIVDQQSGVVRDVLAEKYAELLFQKAILEIPESLLINVTVLPVEPTTHIKPKRLKLVMIATMLGGILGIAIVLIRFAFRREELETE